MERLVKTRPPYDYASEARWEIWARKYFRGRLRKPCLAFLLLALRDGERIGAGFGRPVVANFWKLADWGLINKNSVGRHLREASGIAIELKKGQALIKGAATQIRRMSIEEMEKINMKTTLRDHTPQLAETVAARLRERGIPWGDETVRPQLAIAKTGRIYTSRPNIQGDGQRLGKIAAGLPVGWCAIELDFRQAEPTVLRHILKQEALFTGVWPDDIYQSLATVCGKTRDEAKETFLSIMYSPNTKAALRNLGTVLEDPFWGRLADAVERLKERLWSKSKPRKGGRRFTTTLCGTRMEALKGESMHKGKLLSWVLQGTVADILNQATADLLAREAAGGWQVLCPVHDSVIVTAPNENTTEMEGILAAAAQKNGLQLQVRPKVMQGKLGVGRTHRTRWPAGHRQVQTEHMDYRGPKFRTGTALNSRPEFRTAARTQGISPNEQLNHEIATARIKAALQRGKVNWPPTSRLSAAEVASKRTQRQHLRSSRSGARYMV